ncbi:hypothetical protein CYLTODRAFT_421579 [Cylindrobasidium torrendii FP15055 ss-10]|uniref:Uncharacterized protein n=1 Tax=Cylindrobasidium torrendii FP15055 ss-10 TaxID=1314674 RepID=A0A0D7BFS4_9AGAR|nr:hypothetical protein CYLTODRAFT_421579 [Cylindrobasidium torrendii FP15055 ss-10]
MLDRVRHAPYRAAHASKLFQRSRRQTDGLRCPKRELGGQTECGRKELWERGGKGEALSSPAM